MYQINFYRRSLLVRIFKIVLFKFTFNIKIQLYNKTKIGNTIVKIEHRLLLYTTDLFNVLTRYYEESYASLIAGIYLYKLYTYVLKYFLGMCNVQWRSLDYALVEGASADNLLYSGFTNDRYNNLEFKIF